MPVLRKDIVCAEESEVELCTADALAVATEEQEEEEQVVATKTDASNLAPSSKLLTFSHLWPELKVQISLGLPIITSSVLQMSLELITMMALGRRGVEELDGGGLGRVLANCTGFALMLGMLMAMDTLTTQAYGAGIHSRVGDVAQRSLCITGLAAIPIVVFWWNAEPVLLLLGQDPAVSALAATYLRCLSPTIVPFLGLEIVKRYLQAQGMVNPITCLLLLSMMVHLVATYILTWPLGLGFIGCPLAFSISYSCALMMGLGFVRFGRRCPKWFISGDPMQCWTGWSRAAFRDWRPFMRIGLPSMVLVSLDWWSFELLAFMTGLLGTTPFASANIIIQLIGLLFMPPLGLSVATCIRVGQHLGAADISGAHRSALVGLGMTASMGLVNSMLVFSLLRLWALSFTDDADVVGLVMACRWVIGSLMWFDAMQAGMGGLLRGTGLQAWGAGVNFLSQWAIGLPLAACFTFLWHWGLPGLYGGLLCGVILIPFLHSIILLRADWEKLAKTARSRAGCVDGDCGEP